jgi:hypothetical protein
MNESKELVIYDFTQSINIVVQTLLWIPSTKNLIDI